VVRSPGIELFKRQQSTDSGIALHIDLAIERGGAEGSGVHGAGILMSNAMDRFKRNSAREVLQKVDFST
jgi:hypothetical protein